MASYSVVKICNIALTMLGAEHITSITESGENASACNAMYDTCRDELLVRYPWTFSIDYAELSRLTATHETDAYQYQLPSDCLQPLSVYGTMPQPDWYVNGQYLVTSETSITLEYVKETTDPSKFSVGFANALAALLALRISPVIHGSMSNVDRLMEIYERQYRMGINIDARIGSSYMPDMTDPDNDPQITNRG